ncbi:MAG: hypothetical protein ACTJHY_05485 [Alcaligenes pakistanensis]
MSSRPVQREYWFGLQWANAGQGLRRAQMQQAAQSYWTCSIGADAQAVGWVQNGWLKARQVHSVLRLAQEGPTRRRLAGIQAYSAAACLAAHHPQETIFLLWTVAPKCLWFLVLDQGLVVEGSDCLLAQVGQVQALRQAMQERYPSIRELRQPDDLWVCLEQGRRPHGGLRQQTRRRVWRFKKLSVHLLVSTLLVVAALWGILSADLMGQLTTRVSDQGPISTPVELASRSALSVLGLLEELPYQGVNWQLQQVDCQRRSADWECQAQYGFEDVQSFSLAMQSQIRASSVLEFSGQGQATLQVRRVYQDLPATSVAGLKLGDRRYAQTGLLAIDAVLNEGEVNANAEQADFLQPAALFAELEALRPAFMRFSLAQARPVESGDVDESAGVGRWYRSWRSQSPLRSAYLLAAQLPDLQWDRLRLALNSQAYPSLLGSTFIVELEGDVYEQEDLDEAARAKVFEHSVWSDADADYSGSSD